MKSSHKLYLCIASLVSYTGTSEESPQNASLTSDCSTICGRGKRARKVRDQACYFAFIGEPLQERGRAMLFKKLLFGLFKSSIVRGRHVLNKYVIGFRMCRTRQDRVDRHAGSFGHLRHTARHHYLARFGDAIVDHVGMSLRPGFAGYENDAAPISTKHAREVMPSQSTLSRLISKNRSHSSSVMSTKFFDS